MIRSKRLYFRSNWQRRASFSPKIKLKSDAIENSISFLPIFIHIFFTFLNSYFHRFTSDISPVVALLGPFYSFDSYHLFDFCGVHSTRAIRSISNGYRRFNCTPTVNTNFWMGKLKSNIDFTSNILFSNFSIPFLGCKPIYAVQCIPLKLCEGLQTFSSNFQEIFAVE